MISSKDCIPTILKMFPEFESTWKAHLEYWGEDEPGFGNDIAKFSHFIAEKITEGETINLKKVFDLMEDWMINGDEEVKTIIATCFLENLQHRVDWKDISADKLVPFLGPESIAYCRAWDEFNGAQTPGFWEEGAPPFKPKEFKTK